MAQSHKTVSKRRSFGAWIKSKVGSQSRKVAHTDYGGRVFQVPLVVSIQYASMVIRYRPANDTAKRQSGLIPMVVAKCGAYLKAHGLQSQGIFRQSGNLKRVRELEEWFDDPARQYGAKVDWTDYRVHDVASVLRRYLCKLPDPVINHAFYHDFRNVMSDNRYNSIQERLNAFNTLIRKLPEPHCQLLFYLLDMLSLFACHAEETKMDINNLAAVFCPSILSHPDHNSPLHYMVSQRVLEFLIEFQNVFDVSPGQRCDQEMSCEKNEEPPVPPLPDWAVGHAANDNWNRRPPTPESMDHMRQPSQSSEADPSSAVIDYFTLPATQCEAKNTTPKVEKPHLPRAISHNVCQDGARDMATPPPSPDSSHGKETLSGIVATSVITVICLHQCYQGLLSQDYANAAAFLLGFAACGMLLATNTTAGQATPDNLTMAQETVPTPELSPTTETKDEVDSTDYFNGPHGFAEQDLAEQERVVMLNQTVMSEWGNLMRRSWRTDPSTPYSILNRRESDYFGVPEQKEDDTVSTMSVASRFTELDTSAVADDEELLDDDEDLHVLWQQFQQIERDALLAEEIARAEQEAVLQKDRVNPFISGDTKETVILPST